MTVIDQIEYPSRPCEDCESCEGLRVYRHDESAILCSGCIASSIVNGDPISNFSQINKCDRCDSDAEVCCESCAEGEWSRINKCDSCDGESRVLCSSCASEEWGSGTRECDDCSSEAELCSSCAGDHVECVECGDTGCEMICADCGCAERRLGTKTCPNCERELMCVVHDKVQCVVCDRNFTLPEHVCNTCQHAKVADGVVSFTAHGVDVEYRERR